MLAEQAKSRRPNPRLASRPTLRTDTRSFWTHFLTLADSRTFNEAGEQPIPISEIVGYSDLVGIRRGEPALKFFRVMRAMDNTYLKWQVKKAKRNAQNKKARK